jgi:hypothetical protein
MTFLVSQQQFNKKEVDKEKLKLSIHFKGERAGRQRKKKKPPNSSIPKKEEKKTGSQKRKKEMFKKLLQRRKTWRSKIK